MICHKCGGENPDNFNFCQHCGKRLDGKKRCPACGAEVDESAAFCGFCGKDFAAETEVAATSAEAVAGNVPAEAEKVKTGKFNLKKIADISGFVLIAFAALMGFIFTFCISVQTSSGGVAVSSIIYEYFGKVYKDISTAGLNPAQETLVYLPNAFGTAIAAGAIVCNAVFFGLTIYAAVKKFVRKQEGAKFEKYATASYVSFAVFATLFLAMHSTEISSSASGVTVSESIAFSAATVAGLVLGGIGLGGYYCCYIAGNIFELKTPAKIFSFLKSLVPAVIAIVVIALIAQPVVKFSYSETGNYFTQSYEISLGFFYPPTFALNSADTEMLIKLIVFEAVGFVCQIVIAAVTAKIIVKLSSTLFEESSVLGLSVTNLIFAVGNLTCAVLMGQTVGEFVGEETALAYAMPIAVLVVSFLIFALAVAVKAYYSVTRNK